MNTIKLSFSVYLIWTCVAILSIVSAWIKKLRFLNCGLQCLMFMLQLVAIVVLALVRLSPDGIACADPTMGNKQNTGVGAFLGVMLAFEVLLTCFAACCLAVSGTYSDETHRRMTPEQNDALVQLQHIAERKKGAAAAEEKTETV